MDTSINGDGGNKDVFWAGLTTMLMAFFGTGYDGRDVSNGGP